jgi:hypothetical protein
MLSPDKTLFSYFVEKTPKNSDYFPEQQHFGSRNKEAAVVCAF